MREWWIGLRRWLLGDGVLCLSIATRDARREGRGCDKTDGMTSWQKVRLANL